MNSKLLFFDIDGTLVDFNRNMPDSAREALKKVQRGGHKILLCTGRGKSQIYPHLLDFGFDGIIAAGGAYIEYNGKVLYHNTFGEERIKQAAKIFRRHQISFMLQQEDGCYLSGDSLYHFRDTLMPGHEDAGSDEVLEYLQDSLGTIILDNNILDHPTAYTNTESILYTNSPISFAEIQGLLGPSLTVTAASYATPRPSQGEITIAGITKAYGIQQIIDYTSIAREDTIAFGDAANDLNMMLFAGKSVAMGNAISEVKQAADFVTTDINDNGIANAIRTIFSEYD